MKTISIQIPDEFELRDDEIIKFLAAKLYEDGILSMGKAAKLCGMDKKDFILILNNYGVSIFSYEEGELKHDIENA